MKHRVVILGGGFAGLNAAQRLRNVPCDVTLIDRRNHHLFQPLLYQVATGALSPADIAAPLRHLLHRSDNTRVLLGEVTDVDLASRVVLLGAERVPYDSLVVATGSQPFYFGHDQWGEHAIGLKEVHDATRICADVLLAFERAELAALANRPVPALTFVVIGGGPTGVELSGALAELARDTLARDFRKFDPRSARVILIEGGPRVLPTFPPGLSAHARRALEKRGVEVRTDCQVVAVDAHCVRVRERDAERSIDVAAVLWAAGVRPSRLGEVLCRSGAAELDRQGRVIVDERLALPGHSEVFVVGDLAHFEQPRGSPLPAVAPVAMQQGSYVASVLKARLRGKSVSPFRFRARGNMAVIGRSDAVVELGPLHFSGYLAWLLWLFVHLLYLAGFANRLLVLLQWGWSYFTHSRAARLISDRA